MTSIQRESVSVSDPAFPPAQAVVEVTKLSRRFGRKLALNDVTFSIPRGCVLGLVGENGAGKTTLVRHLLGMLKAQSGSVRVFERDPVADPVGVLSRVGYLSERRDLPGCPAGTTRHRARRAID